MEYYKTNLGFNVVVIIINNFFVEYISLLFWFMWIGIMEGDEIGFKREREEILIFFDFSQLLETMKNCRWLYLGR